LIFTVAVRSLPKTNSAGSAVRLIGILGATPTANELVRFCGGQGKPANKVVKAGETEATDEKSALLTFAVPTILARAILPGAASGALRSVSTALSRPGPIKVGLLVTPAGRSVAATLIAPA
jgi:hypothetical protein